MARPSCDTDRSLLHRTLVMEAILAVLDDRGHGLQRQLAVGALDNFLEIKILDRKLVVALTDRTPHLTEIGLADRPAHGLLVGQITSHRGDCGIDQHCRIIALGPVEGWPRTWIFGSVVANELP